MKIAVDAMGTDNRPIPDVKGAVLAARERNAEIILVGDEEIIGTELKKHQTSGLSIVIENAQDDIKMSEKPTEAAKAKSESTMHVGLNLVRDKKADAFVSAGHTGALLTISTLYTIRRLRGVKRPAITGVIPTLSGVVVISDIGANADCRPEYLVQFAIMANLYSKLIVGIESPRVALLSNGEEEGKGNQLIKETLPLLRSQRGIKFVGNVEPKEVFNGEADVVIHDGFTGNIFVKTAEASMKTMKTLIKQEISSSIITSVGGLLAKPAFSRVSERMSEEAIGGAPLLGLNGIVISAHGRSNEIAIKNAIYRAAEAVEAGLLGKITDAIEESENPQTND